MVEESWLIFQKKGRIIWQYLQTLTGHLPNRSLLETLKIQAASAMTPRNAAFWKKNKTYQPKGIPTYTFPYKQIFL